MAKYSRKEVYLLKNTLSVVPLLLRGQAVLIELRDETSVAGVLDDSDGYMNINLVNAVYIDRNGLQYFFTEFMVRERMIRYIHIPSGHDVMRNMESWFSSKITMPAHNQSSKISFKKKRAEQRHKEIVQQIIQEQDNQSNPKLEPSS